MQTSLQGDILRHGRPVRPLRPRQRQGARYGTRGALEREATVQRTRVLPETLHYTRARLRIEGVDGGLVAEGAGRFVPAVRDARDDACVDVFVQGFELF